MISERLEDLEKQLKQKDIENRILKSFIILFHPEIARVHGKNELNEDVFITLDEYYTIAEQEIRHQVCEEIRNKIAEYYKAYDANMFKILDQIEKGE